MTQSKTKKPTSLVEKLFECQKEFTAITKDATNDYFKSNYFDINALLRVVKPILSRNGIVLMQPVGMAGQECVPTIHTILISAEDPTDKIEYVTPLPKFGDPQKQGGAVTYFRRYALVSMLGLEAEDDDGNLASGRGGTKRQSAGQKKSNSDLDLW